MPPKKQKRKQVLGDPKSFRGEFSFVNKDASNIDSKDHNAAVSWHVMNRYERWKRKESAKKMKSSKGLPEDPSVSSDAATSVGTVSVTRSGTKYALTTYESDLGTTTDAYPPAPWEMENLEQAMIDSSEPSSSNAWIHSSFIASSVNQQPIAQSNQVSADLELSGQQQPSWDATQYPPPVAQILSFAYGYVVPNTWPNEHGRAKWTYEITRTWDDIAAIGEDSCYASALLCFFTTLMATATNDRDITSQACFFQVQAMTELRQRLERQLGPPDLATLKAILKLFSAETALDNTSAARVHMKSLRNFVSSAGGVMVLEPWFRENLLATDTYFALKYETRPLFPAHEWTPGPMSQPWKTRISHAGIREDHSATINPGIDHTNLRSIVTDLRELFTVEQYINTHEIASDDQLLRWRQLKKCECLNRLAEHQLAVKIYPHLYESPKLQLAVCASITMIAGMVLGSPEPVRTGLKILTELRIKVIEARAELEKIVAEKDEVTSINCAKVMLWNFYVGVLGEQAYPVLDQSTWYRDEFNAHSSRHSFSNLEVQRSIMKTFLFSLALETEIQDGRRIRVSEPRRGVYEPSGTSWRAPLDSGMEPIHPEEQVSEGWKGKQKDW